MAPSKRDRDDAAAWEGAPATKRPRLTRDLEQLGILDDAGNFGSISSQRPKRERKRPGKYADTTPKPSPRKRTMAPKTTAGRPPKKPAANLKRTKVSKKQSKKQSKNVSLKVPLDSLPPATFTFPDQEQKHKDDGSNLSPPPSALLPSPVSGSEIS